MRLIFTIIGAVIVISYSTPLLFWAMHRDQPTSEHSFIYVNILINTGISFGMNNSNTALVYFLQWTTSLIIIGIALFSSKWYYSLFLALAFTGGLFNVIQRSCNVYVESCNGYATNAVVDYFSFSFGKTSWNLPDVSIITGCVGSILFYVINISVSYFKERKEKVNDAK
jgi:lipoprotein signal peptidase